MGEVVSYNDKVADIFYHSICGGHTDNSNAEWGKFLECIVDAIDVKNPRIISGKNFYLFFLK